MAPVAGEQIEILSNVNATNPKLEWQHKSFMVPHEPIRRDMRIMAEAMTLQRVPRSQSWKIPAFMAWYRKYFDVMVRHHHDIEESIIFPWIKERCDMPAKMSDDHTQLLQRMDGIKDFEAQFEQAANDDAQWTSVMEKFEQAVKELVQSMTEHLDEEEEFTPVMAEKYTQAEHDKVLQGKVLKALPLSAQILMIPWMLDAMMHWGGEAEVKAFIDQIPLPLRLMLVHRWRPAYLKKNKAVLESLLLDQEEPPAGIVKGPGIFSCGGGGKKCKSPLADKTFKV